MCSSLPVISHNPVKVELNKRRPSGWWSGVFLFFTSFFTFDVISPNKLEL